MLFRKRSVVAIETSLPFYIYIDKKELGFSFQQNLFYKIPRNIDIKLYPLKEARMVRRNSNFDQFSASLKRPFNGQGKNSSGKNYIQCVIYCFRD